MSAQAADFIESWRMRGADTRGPARLGEGLIQLSWRDLRVMLVEARLTDALGQLVNDVREQDVVVAARSSPPAECVQQDVSGWANLATN